MKKVFHSALAFLALALLLAVAGNSKSVLAATTDSSGNTVSQIVPQDADTSGEQVYRTKVVTGPDTYYEVIPVQVGTPGVLVMKTTGVETGKGVSISLHNGADATDANRLAYKFLYSSAVSEERKIPLEKSGIYYLRIETSQSAYSAGLEQSVDISLCLYPSSKTLKSGETYRVGQVGTDYQYYTLKVNSTGYIQVSPKQLGTDAYSFYVNLFDSKGNAYNKKRYVYLKDGSTVFGVKKGTYKIGIKTSNALYSIKATFKKYTDQSGASQKKAKTIEKGKTVKGMILSTDKTSTKDWYKFTLTKAAKPKLIFTTNMALGGLKVVCHRGKESTYPNTVYAGGNEKRKGTITLGAGIAAAKKLPKGTTCYVQVTPSEAGSSGTYSIQLKY